MAGPEIICILCLVSLLLLAWSILLHTKLSVLESEVKALKHYINTKRKLNVGPNVEHPE